MKHFTIAKLLLTNSKGEILCLRRSKTDSRRPGQWDFPGGRVDAGEDIMAAALRETLEETGIEAKSATMIFGLSEVTPDYGSGTWAIFTVPVLRDDVPVILDPHEHDDYKWMTPAQFMAEAKYERQIKIMRYVHENKLLEA